MFSHSMQTGRTYFTRGKQLVLPGYNHWTQPLAVLAGISLEQDWEQVHYRARSFNSEGTPG